MTARGSGVVTGIAAAGGVAILLRLSAWQWDRATSRDSLLNYVYAVEWLIAAVALVAVVVRHRAHPAAPDDEASRDVHGHVVGPPLRPGEQLPEPTGVRLRRWLQARGTSRRDLPAGQAGDLRSGPGRRTRSRP